jgi:hypothetical protein
MSVVPRIADIRCRRIVFQPGDRILVRSHHRLDKEKREKIKKSVSRWAGADVEVLVYCPLDFELEIEHCGNIIG